MSVNTLLNGILNIDVKSITNSNGDLRINGTTTFSGNNHIGQTVIPLNGTTTPPIPVVGMNNDAVILLTARNSVDSLWVVPTNDSFTVHTATPVGADITVDYFILKID